MITGYSYDVWDGRSVVGQYWSLHQIQGEYLELCEVPTLKQVYGRKIKTIKIPIVCVESFNDGVEFRFRFSLDVRKKSKRQIKIILGKK